MVGGTGIEPVAPTMARVGKRANTAENTEECGSVVPRRGSNRPILHHSASQPPVIRRLDPTDGSVLAVLRRIRIVEREHDMERAAERQLQ